MITLDDLAFDRKAPHPLLGVDADRFEPDLDFAGFGWGVLPHVELSSAGGAISRKIEHALVLALHTPDDPRLDSDELELEFWLEHEGDELAVLVPWSTFGPRFVAPLIREHRDVVLAMCNPANRRVETPAWLGSRRLHYAYGDVIAWMDSTPTTQTSFRLSADRWSIAG